MELDLQNPFTACGEQKYDGIPALFANEADHMPCPRSLQSSDFRQTIRRDALSLIYNAKFSYRLDSFLAYLAVNYVDRFLSKQEILEKRPWMAHILVVASLSMAAKMTNSGSSVLLADLQRAEGVEFDQKSVRRMETVLLATLQWRMRSITPFSFLHYFLSLVVVEPRDSWSTSTRCCLQQGASDIIFNIQHELKLLQFKPSIIAASALLCAIHDSSPATLSSSMAAISSCQWINKDTLMACVNMMMEIKRVDHEPEQCLDETINASSFTPEKCT